jgi:hypothetical protein
VLLESLERFFFYYYFILENSNGIGRLNQADSNCNSYTPYINKSTREDDCFDGAPGGVFGSMTASDD